MHTEQAVLYHTDSSRDARRLLFDVGVTSFARMIGMIGVMMMTVLIESGN
jgi:hypothetical protein